MLGIPRSFAPGFFFQASTVPGFHDARTQQKMQTNTAKFKLNPQVLLWSGEVLVTLPARNSCEAFLQGPQQRVCALGPCTTPGSLKSWSFDTMETCNLGFLALQPWNHQTWNPATLGLQNTGAFDSLQVRNLGASWCTWVVRWGPSSFT